MSPLPEELLKTINFLQHETSQACTHLKLAEILCRQKYIPNEKCTYNIFIFESSVVETQFWGSIPALKFFFHGTAYYSLFLQRDRGTIAATSLVPFQWENYKPLFTRSWVSENLKMVRWPVKRSGNFNNTFSVQLPLEYFGGVGGRLLSLLA